MTIMYIIMNVLMYGSIIGIMTMLPYLTRKNLAFGVSIPAEASDSKVIKAYRNRYVKLNLSVGAIMMGLVIVVHIVTSINIASIVAAVLLMVYIGCVYAVFYQTHKKVKLLKVEKGWAKSAKDIRLVDTSMMMENQGVTPLWFGAHIMTIIVTALILTTNYEKISDRIPMKMDMAGNVTSYVAKSPMALAFPVLMQITMLVVFVVVYVVITKTAPYINPDDPEVGKVQAKAYKKAWSNFALIMGYMMVVLFGVIAISMVGWISMTSSGVISIIFVIALLLYTIILAVKLGQSGSRFKPNSSKGSTINREDDRYWKAGMFYVNKEDPSYFVEKRFGVGFTINFGRPLAVLIMIALIAFIIGMSLFASFGV